jgi:hypothetical protein
MKEFSQTCHFENFLEKSRHVCQNDNWGGFGKFLLSVFISKSVFTGGKMLTRV